MAPPVRDVVKATKSAESCKTPGGKPSGKPGDLNDCDIVNVKKRILPGPSQSPRDPNMYRVLRLQNGMLIALSSTCSFNEDELNSTPCKTHSAGRVQSGTRSKCKRTRSDFEAPKNKRSRPKKDPVVKDLNCVDEKVMEFNQEVLHICTTEAECPQPSGGFLSWALVCCNPSTTADMQVESDEDQVDDDPGAPEDGRRESTWSSMNADVEQEEFKRNLRSRADRVASEEEDDEEPNILDCKRGRSAPFSVCSVAMSLPWGPIFESDDAPGVSELCRNCIQGCDYAHASRQEDITFVAYLAHSKEKKNLIAAVECMAQKFYPPSFDKACIEKTLKRLKSGGSFADRLKSASWGKGYENLLLSPKRIKLLSTLTKEDHPIRRCALGGKLNQTIQELNRNVLDRSLNEYLQNVCKPQYTTIAVEAPESLDSLEETVLPNFGKVGQLGSNKPPEVHTVDGDPEPFDTQEFRKLYKVWPCPHKSLGVERGDGHWIFLSFPLPAEAWKNYKTQPLIYLTHIVGHKGIGGLQNYLAVKNWLKTMHAECSQTQFHRNQFASLFEISMLLTNEGFEQRLQVLQVTFAYLRMLAYKGPQKRIFKELQKIQSVDFHYLGKNLDDPHTMSDARHLSKALQYAKSEDIILAGAIMTTYNGPLLSELLNLLTPDLCNITIVSETFDEDEIDQEEPFLVTKYGVQDIPPEWMSIFKSNITFPELTTPDPNPFIPDNFCIVQQDVNVAKVPVHLTGDYQHDLWHLCDPGYGSRAGTVIHFVSPMAMLDLESATKMTFFFRMFKTLLRPALYPAELARTEYMMERTDFGILVSIETNADKLPTVLGAMADRLNGMQDLITPEFFENQKTLFRKKVCCQAKDPAYYASWLHSSAALLNASCPTDYLPVLDNLTMEEMIVFIETVKKDIFCMNLAVGNLTRENALQMNKSMNDSFILGGVGTGTGKVIEQVEVLQWPVGERVIRVKGFGHSPSTHMSCFYQLGISDSTTIVMAALIEPLLQGCFLKNMNLMSNEIFVMVGTNHIHNVLELELRTNVPDNMTPEDVNEMIEDELYEFYNNRLCSLKQKELDDWKKTYLCSCDPNCAWFTSGSNLSLFRQGVLNLNMNSIGVGVQSQSCERLKIKGIQEWFQRYVMENTDKDAVVKQDKSPERRKLTVIVMKKPPKPPLPVDSAILKTQQKKKSKKKESPCGKEPYLDFIVEIPGEEEEDDEDDEKIEKCEKKPKGKSKGKKKEDEPFEYIRDLEFFKQDCFIYPVYIPRD